MSESHIKSILYEEYSKDPTNFCSIGQEISVAIPNCSFTGISKSHDGIHMDFCVDKNSNGLVTSDTIIKDTFGSFLNELKVPMNDEALSKSIHILKMPGSFTIII